MRSSPGLVRVNLLAPEIAQKQSGRFSVPAEIDTPLQKGVL
jgi:hypothetical protein